MMTYMLRTLILSLLLTIVCEVLAALCFRIRSLSTVILVNCITNPVYVMTVLIAGVFIAPEARIVLQIILELIIFLSEGFLYKKKMPACGQPYLFSFCANAFSVLAGILLSRII